MRDSGAGTPLGPEGQVDVLHLRESGGSLQLAAEVLSEQLPLGQGAQHGLATFVEFGELLQPVTHGRHGHLIQRSRGLLAVAGDERHGGPGGQQIGGRRHLVGLHAQLGGYDAVIGFGEGFDFARCCHCSPSFARRVQRIRDGRLRERTGRCDGFEPSFSRALTRGWIK